MCVGPSNPSVISGYVSLRHEDQHLALRHSVVPGIIMILTTSSSVIMWPHRHLLLRAHNHNIFQPQHSYTPSYKNPPRINHLRSSSYTHSFIMSMFYLGPDASHSVLALPQRSFVYPRAPTASFSTSALRHRATVPTSLRQEWKSDRSEEKEGVKEARKEGRFRAVLAMFRLGRRGNVRVKGFQSRE